jgi:hypothetical protein
MQLGRPGRSVTGVGEALRVKARSEQISVDAFPSNSEGRGQAMQIGDCLKEVSALECAVFGEICCNGFNIFATLFGRVALYAA